MKSNPSPGDTVEFFRIGHQKPAFVAPLRAANIALIPVDTQIIAVCKMARVSSRAASNVQHSPRSPHVVMRGNGCKLLLCEGSHPKPVDDWLSHDRFEKIHCLHLT